MKVCMYMEINSVPPIQGRDSKVTLLLIAVRMLQKFCQNEHSIWIYFT